MHFFFQDDLIRMFQLGNFQSFWKIWDQHIHKDDVEKNETQRLIFTLQLYFAVFPLFEDEVYFIVLLFYAFVVYCFQKVVYI